MNQQAYFGPYPYEGTFCPRCKSTDVKLGDHWHTLLGWSPQYKDPNHHTQKASCPSCGLEFAIHWKPSEDHRWCTVMSDETRPGLGGDKLNISYVIAGVPMCCPSHHRAPCTCGGWMQNRQEGNVVVSKPDESGKWTSNPPPLWDCLSCDRKGLTLDEVFPSIKKETAKS